MRSKMLIGVLVFALAAAVVGGATMAWFTDSDESAPVTFSAGTLLIDLHEDISYEELDVDNLNPGDEKEWKIIVENKGTKNLVHKVVICWDDILGIDRDDVDFGDREGYGTNPLSEAIEFTVTGQGENQPDIVLTQGTLAGKPKPLDYNYEVKLAPGEEYTYKIYAEFPGEESGNEYQGSQLKAAFIALARQWQEGAVYPEYECPFGEEITLGNFYHYLGTVTVDGSDYWGQVNQVEVFGVEDGTGITVTMEGMDGQGDYIMHGTVVNGIATVIANDIIAAGSYNITVEVNGKTLTVKQEPSGCADIVNYYPGDHNGSLLH